MKRQVMAALVILVNAQSVFAGKQVLSYYARGNDFGSGGEGLNVIPSVPDGFVVTDIYASREGSGGIESLVLTTSLPGPTDITQIWSQRVNGTLAYETHFDSGLRVPTGVTLSLGFEGVVFNDVTATISGYIETPTDNNQQTVSFYSRGSDANEGLHVIPSVPANFVLTDIYVSRPASGGSNVLSLHTYDAGPSNVALFWSTRVGSSLTFETHLQSGIPVQSGKLVTVAYEGEVFGDVTVTLSGYIASPTSSNAPAVGTWGMIILGCVILIVGSRAIMQRRVAA